MSRQNKQLWKKQDKPPDHVLGFSTQVDIIWEREMVWPIDDLLVRIVRVLRAEWWISDQAFEHDRTKRPPVALVSVSLKEEDLRCDIVGCSHRRVSLVARRNLVPIHCKYWDQKKRTSFRRFAFHVAMVLRSVIVKWIGLTMTLFRAGFGATTPLAESKSR